MTNFYLPFTQNLHLLDYTQTGIPPNQKNGKPIFLASLFWRALKLCSKSKLQEELNRIRSTRSTLKQNGYPEIVINSSILNKIFCFNLELKEGPQKCPVYLKLSWIEKFFLKFESQIKSAIQKSYGAVDLLIIFLARNFLQTIYKYALPSTYQSKVVYQYEYRRDYR